MQNEIWYTSKSLGHETQFDIHIIFFFFFLITTNKKDKESEMHTACLSYS